MTNQNELGIEYGDAIKAYQNKVNELISQLITAEAKLIASANFINKLSLKVQELEEQNQELSSSKTTRKTTKVKQESEDNVIDYNS